MLDTARPPSPAIVGRLPLVLGTTAGASALFTVLVAGVPDFRFAFRSPETHVAIETAATLAPALAAVLSIGRLRMHACVADLLLTAALITFAATNLLFSLLPALISDSPGGSFATWAPVLGRGVAAVLLCWAAFGSQRRLPDPKRSLGRLGLAIGAGALTIAAFAWLAGPSLPDAIDPQLSPESSNRPHVVGALPVLVIQLATMAVYAAAAVGFARRAVVERDEFSAWFATATVLGAFARLNYFLFPSLYSEWVYTGDFLRVGFHLVVLIGAVREIWRIQKAQAVAAVLSDRRRMARELHDGLAQELAFIATHTQRLGLRTVGRRTDQAILVDQLTEAAHRALDEARAAIEVLATPLGEPLRDAIERAAEHAGERYGVRVRAVGTSEVEVPAGVQDSLVRIVREAVSNAARHGEASAVDVELSGPAPLVMRIRDDGRGFDAASPNGSGFGLTSMRERAGALGGELKVTSQPGAGTTVEVRIP